MLALATVMMNVNAQASDKGSQTLPIDTNNGDFVGPNDATPAFGWEDFWAVVFNGEGLEGFQGLGTRRRTVLERLDLPAVRRASEAASDDEDEDKLDAVIAKMHEVDSSELGEYEAVEFPELEKELDEAVARVLAADETEESGSNDETEESGDDEVSDTTRRRPNWADPNRYRWKFDRTDTYWWMDLYKFQKCKDNSDVRRQNAIYKAIKSMGNIFHKQIQEQLNFKLLKRCINEAAHYRRVAAICYRSARVEAEFIVRKKDSRSVERDPTQFIENYMSVKGSECLDKRLPPHIWIG